MHDKILLAKLHAKIDESAKKYIYLLQTAKPCNVKKNYFNIYLDKCIVQKRREDVIKCSRNALTYLETYLDKND